MFYSRYKLPFEPPLPIPTLIFGLHKMPQNFDQPLYFRFGYSKESPY